MDNVLISQQQAFEQAYSQLALNSFSLLVEDDNALPGKVRDLDSALARLTEAQSVILKQSQRIAQLERLALTDELTGLMNRRGLMMLLRREKEQLRRGLSQDCVLVLVDLDGFKQINDRFGHVAGDHYLQAVARTLQLLVRTGDTVARLGGDEFAILMPSLGAGYITPVLTRLCDLFAAESLGWMGHQLPLRASFGEVRFTAVDTPEAIFAEADERLYQAKEQRRHGQRLLEASKSNAV
jgi:diguanylate cyclase (GGDEF)-like protein